MPKLTMSPNKPKVFHFINYSRCPTFQNPKFICAFGELKGPKLDISNMVELMH